MKDQTPKQKADECVALYLSSKDAILHALEQVPAEKRERCLLAFQIAWNDVALEHMGSAWVAGIYDAALDGVEGAAPSRAN